jgi:hypothetical protein
MRHAASFGPDNDVIHPPPAFVPKIPAATLSLAGSQATPPLHLPCSSCFFFTYPRFAICSGSQARLPQAECRHRWGAPMAGCGAAEVSRSRMDFCCSGEAVPPPRNPAAGDILLACSRRHPTFRVLSLWPRWRRPALLQPRVRARPSGGCSTSDAEHGGQAQSYRRNNE